MNQKAGLLKHEAMVRAISFRPDTLLLASAVEDGCLYLWQKLRRIVQTLEGAADGFSCLAWSKQGTMLAACGSGGELWVWTETTKGKVIIILIVDMVLTGINYY